MTNDKIKPISTYDLVEALKKADPNTVFFKMTSPVEAVGETVFEAHFRKLRTQFDFNPLQASLEVPVYWEDAMRDITLQSTVSDILAEVHTHPVKMMVGIYGIEYRVTPQGQYEFALQYAMQPLPATMDDVHAKHASMRAKFIITRIKPYLTHDGIVSHEHIEMHAVCGDSVQHGYPKSGDDEDSTFSKWTPSAELTMEITNPALFGQYHEGDKLYCDFTLASKEEGG